MSYHLILSELCLWRGASTALQVYSDRPASSNEIKEALEGHDLEAKVEAMQKAISMLLNGEQLPALFITIVRYVLPSEDHTVQKLLLLYLVSFEGSLPCTCGTATGTVIILMRPNTAILHRVLATVSLCNSAYLAQQLH